MQITFNELDEKGKRKEIDIKILDQERIINLNGVKVCVKFKRDYFGNAQIFYVGEDYTPHIEIQSLNNEPNVLTETGYRSYFFWFDTLKESKSFEEMVEKVLKNSLDYDWKDKGKRALKNKPELKIEW